MESFWKSTANRMKGWVLTSNEDRMGPGLGTVQVGQITRNSHGSSNGHGSNKAVVAQSLPFFPATASLHTWQSLAVFPFTASSKGKGAVGGLLPITEIRSSEPRVCLSCMYMELGTVGVSCLPCPESMLGSSMNSNTM